MSTNKILLAALAGGVISFLPGWITYGILEVDFVKGASEISAETAAAIKREPMVLWAFVLSSLTYGLILAIIFGRWANFSTFLAGAKAGAIFAFLVTLGFNFSMYSMSKIIPLSGALLGPLVSTIHGALVGGVVGWVLGYGKKAV